MNFLFNTQAGGDWKSTRPSTSPYRVLYQRSDSSGRYMNGSFWQRNQCARMCALVMHTVEDARSIGKSNVCMHTQGENPDPAGATNQGLWVANSWRW